MTTYYYLVLSQEDFLKNQALEELFRERITYLVNEKKCIDFWIIMSPSFFNENSIEKKIKSTKFFAQKQNLSLTAIVSTNKEYITWLHLRLGFFENFLENGELSEINYKSDGLKGSFSENEMKIKNLFFSVPNKVSYSIEIQNR
jgi:hypothetical protein